MFACLQPFTRTHAPLARLREWHSPTPPQMIRVNPPAGAPFFRLEVQEGRGGIPWNAVERTAGRLRTRLLLPEGVSPPLLPSATAKSRSAAGEPGIRPYEPKRLPALLAMRAAQQVLRKSETPAQRLSVAVIDPRGVFTHSLEPLIPLAASIRVFCPDFAIYRATAARLLDRYGVTLILSDSVACFAQSDVVIAADLRPCTGRERGLLFAPEPPTPPPPGSRIARGFNPQLPPALERLRPPGIDPLLFCSALFELCGVKEAELLQFQAFRLAGSGEDALFSIAELAAMVDENKIP
jgi:hypothetical protein